MMLGLNRKSACQWHVFFKKSKNKEEFEDGNNKHNALIDVNDNKHKELSSDEEKDKDEECHAMANDIVNSNLTSNDEKYKRQVTHSKVDESEHNEAFVVAEGEGEFKQERKAVDSVKVKAEC